MVRQSHPIYEFDLLRVDCGNRLLTMNGSPVPVAPKAFDLLVILIERRGTVVTRNELLAEVWPDTCVEESNVAVMISVLRKALGDDGRAQRYIQTVSKSGYRFAVEVRTTYAAEIAPPPPIAVESVTDSSPVPNSAPSVLEVNTSKTWPRSWLVISATLFILLMATAGLFLLRPEFLTSAAIQWASAPTARLQNSNVKLLTQNPRDPVFSQGKGGTASELYQKGRYSWNRRTSASLWQSIKYYQQAIAVDPRYALAYAGIADAYILLASFSVEPAERTYLNAKRTAEKAIALDATLAEPHASLGMIAFLYDWDWRRADTEFRQAIRLRPTYSTAHHWFGMYLIAMGKTEDAIAELRRAFELDPFSLEINTDLARALYCARRYDDARTELLKVVELDPYFANAYSLLGRVDMRTARFEEAIQALENSIRLGGDSFEVSLLAEAFALAGNRKAAEKILADLTQQGQHELVSSAGIAHIFIGLGQRDQALAWLDKACRQHSLSAVLATVDPAFDPLRPDPRFVDVLRRVGLGTLPMLQHAGSNTAKETAVTYRPVELFSRN